MMICNMKHIYIIALLVMTAGSAFGQTRKAYIKAAEEAYANENYYAALTFYSEALEFDPVDEAIIFKVAESARQFDAYDIALENYSMLVDSLTADSFPIASFHLANMNQRMGRYEDAVKYYNMYITEYSGTDSLAEIQARQMLSNTEWAMGQMENFDKSAIIERMEDINSPFSDFGAVRRDTSLYYSTMIHEEANPKELPARSLSKIHVQSDAGTMLMETTVNDTDSLVAHTAFNTDGSMAYYTVCNYVTATRARCDIYQSPVIDGVFDAGTKLGSAVNVDSFTNTQPHVAYDSDRDMEVLYFVSDRPGGSGKLDIYYSVIDANGNFSEARNLTEVNTEGNEATPYYNTAKNKLYYSSDGRQGMGGYDIYGSVKDEDGKFTSSKGLLPPMNSSYHELYYVVDDVEETGLFSSNRDGSMYVDPAKKACCFDIYSVEYDEIIIDLNALTFDGLTQRPLMYATVHLVDALTGDTLETVVAQNDSSHVFRLRRDTEYLLIAESPEYNTKTVPFSTVDISESTELIEKIYLTTDKMQLDVFTFNNRTKEELAGVTLKIYDVTDPDNPILLETNELSNDFHAYLELGKKYEIQASKFGFVTETDIVDLTDVTEPGLLTKKLYLEVFDVEDYLPAIVYFDHDYPNPKSKSTESDALYGDLYRDYILQKPAFIRKVARRKTAQVKEQAEQDVAAFFEGDIAGGYETMKRFLRALKKELELGRSLEIAVKGYTSPIAETKYNLALGQRRVASVNNEILSYDGGVFKNYIASGQLIITDISFGEELSPADVSDDRRDVIGSIYSVGASKQRRVEIVSIKDQ